MQHVACNVVGSRCNMLSRVGQTNATLCNMVGKRTQHEAGNNVARCCTNMLHPFGQGLTFNRKPNFVSTSPPQNSRPQSCARANPGSWTAADGGESSSNTWPWAAPTRPPVDTSSKARAPAPAAAEATEAMPTKVTSNATSPKLRPRSNDGARGNAAVRCFRASWAVPAGEEFAQCAWDIRAERVSSRHISNVWANLRVPRILLLTRPTESTDLCDRRGVLITWPSPKASQVLKCKVILFICLFVYLFS